MTAKSSYENLEHRIRELEIIVTDRQRLEKKLRESEARFQAFMDNNPALIYIKDETGRHIYGNKTLLDKFDLSPDKFVGTTTKDFFPSEIAEKIEAYDEAVRTGGVPVETDDWSDKWKGRVRWWKENKFPIKLHSGGMLVGGIAFDITGQKLTEKSLEQNLQLQMLLTRISAQFTTAPHGEIDSAIEEGLALIGKHLDIGRVALFQFSSDKTEMHLSHGYSPHDEYMPPEFMVSENLPWFSESLIQGKILKISKTEDLPKRAAAEKQYMKDQRFKSFLTVPMIVGESVMGAISYFDMKKERKWPDQLINQMGILTEMFANALKRKQSENELIESEERYRSLVEGAPISIMAIRDGCFLSVNPAGARMLGFSDPEEMIGLPALNIVTPASRKTVTERIKRLEKGENNPTAEIALIKKDGSKITVKSESVSFPMSGKNTAVILAQDITEHNEAKKKIEELRRFEQLLSDISTSFIDLPAEKIDLAINNALAQVGRFLRVDRCSLGNLTPDHKEMLVTHVWHQKPVSGVQQSYSISQYPWLLSPFMTGKDLLWTKSEGLPTGSEADMRLLEESGMQSFAGIPVSIAGKLTASLGFSSISEQKHWSPELIHRLKHLSRIFGNALARKQVEKDLIKSREDFRSLAGKLLSVQESERRRLARELHDDLTQRLAVLAIELGKIEQSFQGLERLQNIREQLIHLSTDIHAISRQLHPSIIDDLGLVGAVKSECSNFTRREGIAVDYRTKNVPPEIPPDVAICIFRIVQEGLRNVAKHADTKKVAVSLSGKNDLICLRIEDKGIGFHHKEAEEKPGLGLVSMKERVRLIRGDILIESQPGKGSVINVRAPL